MDECLPFAFWGFRLLWQRGSALQAVCLFRTPSLQPLPIGSCFPPNGVLHTMIVSV